MHQNSNKFSGSSASNCLRNWVLLRNDQLNEELFTIEGRIGFALLESWLILIVKGGHVGSFVLFLFLYSGYFATLFFLRKGAFRLSVSHDIINSDSLLF